MGNIYIRCYCAYVCKIFVIMCKGNIHIGTKESIKFTYFEIIYIEATQPHSWIILVGKCSNDVLLADWKIRFALDPQKFYKNRRRYRVTYQSKVLMVVYALLMATLFYWIFLITAQNNMHNDYQNFDSSFTVLKLRIFKFSRRLTWFNRYKIVKCSVTNLLLIKSESMVSFFKWRCRSSKC